MQTSDSLRWHQQWLTLLVLCSLMLASGWLFQQPLGNYWQQTYHRTSPLTRLQQYPAWRQGGLLWERLGAMHVQAMQQLATRLSALGDGFNRDYVLTKQYYLREQQRSRLAAEAAQARRQEQLRQQAVLAEQQRQQARLRYLSLLSTDKVFMAGDSLMQGVAPHLQRELRTRHGINSVNLSKQSTGLAYPSAFNWPGTIAHTIDQDRSIRLLVVMLGPNDPWDMPDPQHPGGPFLRFKSAEWEQAYRQRIAQIISSSASHGVSTLWVEAPGMRAKRLDEQMRWLMAVVKDEVEKQQAVFLPTRSLLPGAQDGYLDSALIDGKSVKMRSADGIHFSLAGQQYLARHVLNTLQFP